MAKRKSEGTNKFAAVLRLISAEPTISLSDLIARLRAEGIDISEATASNYRSTARKQVGVSKPRKGKRRKKTTAAVPLSNGTPPVTKPARGGAEDFITLAALVKKIGPDEVRRFVTAIS